MTINEQLHGSATHKPGIDPACPICMGPMQTVREFREQETPEAKRRHEEVTRQFGVLRQQRETRIRKALNRLALRTPMNSRLDRGPCAFCSVRIMTYDLYRKATTLEAHEQCFHAVSREYYK